MDGPSVGNEQAAGNAGAARRARAGVVIATLTLALVGLAVWRLVSGPLSPADVGWGILIDLRGVPIAVAAVAGAALAVSGCLLQSMLRNPLASPWILGLSAGAGFGVTLEIYLRTRATGAIDVAPALSTPVAALAGSVGALGVVYWLARRRGTLDPVSLLLIGVMVSIIAGAATMFVQQLMPDAGLATAARWMMGSVTADTPWWQVGVAGGVVAMGFAVSMAVARSVDALALGDDEAASVGVNVGRVRLVLFVLAAVLTTAAVVLAGPIGFVGLVCPHAGRLLVGPTHRGLLPVAALAGAVALVGAEFASSAVRTDAGRIPVGVITALVGGPIFIWMLRRAPVGAAGSGGVG